jgi:hypothetical protein
LRQAKSINLTVHLLPEWFDVDTGVELRRLAAELFGDMAPGYNAPHTRAFLSTRAIDLSGYATVKIYENLVGVE